MSIPRKDLIRKQGARLVSLLAVSLLVLGCSDDTSEPDSEPSVLQPREALVGSWELDSLHAADQSHFYDDDEMFWYFYDSGRVNAIARSGLVGYECYFGGSFASSDSTLLITGVEDGPLACSYSFSACSDTLRLAYEFDVGPGWLEFVRVDDAPSDGECDEVSGKPPGE